MTKKTKVKTPKVTDGVDFSNLYATQPTEREYRGSKFVYDISEVYTEVSHDFIVDSVSIFTANGITGNSEPWYVPVPVKYLTVETGRYGSFGGVYSKTNEDGTNSDDDVVKHKTAYLMRNMRGHFMAILRLKSLRDVGLLHDNGMILRTLHAQHPLSYHGMTPEFYQDFEKLLSIDVSVGMSPTEKAEIANISKRLRNVLRFAVHRSFSSSREIIPDINEHRKEFAIVPLADAAFGDRDFDARIHYNEMISRYRDTVSQLVTQKSDDYSELLLRIQGSKTIDGKTIDTYLGEIDTFKTPIMVAIQKVHKRNCQLFLQMMGWTPENYPTIIASLSKRSVNPDDEESYRQKTATADCIKGMQRFLMDEEENFRADIIRFINGYGDSVAKFLSKRIQDTIMLAYNNWDGKSRFKESLMDKNEEAERYRKGVRDGILFSYSAFEWSVNVAVSLDLKALDVFVYNRMDTKDGADIHAHDNYFTQL